MRKTTIMLALFLFAIASPALALGPVDVEAGVSYWLSETTLEAFDEKVSADSEDLSLWGQIWITKWGAKGAIYRVDMDDEEMMEGSFKVDYTSLDVRYKVLELTDNNYVAVGLGYQSLKFDPGRDSIDASGWRVSAEAHFGLGRIVNFYGEGAYYVGMDDLKDRGETIGESLGGWELEVGISVKPWPFLNLRAGYRQSRLDFDFVDMVGKADDPYSLNYEIAPDGFIIGASVNF